MAFENYKKQNASMEHTSEYVVYSWCTEIKGVNKYPKLHLKFAGSKNIPFVNAMHKLDLTKQKRPDRVMIDPTSDESKKQRKGIAQAFAEHIVTAWFDVYDNGKEVPYTTKNGVDFITAMDDEAFAQLVTFAQDGYNFSDQAVEETLALQEKETAIKNSPKDTSTD